MNKQRRKRMHFRFRFIVAEEYQPVESVPKKTAFSLWAIIFIFLGLQVNINFNAPPPKATAINLVAPPSDIILNTIALGDKVTTAKALNLWLQSFDNQQGQSISYAQLDYEIVAAWLSAIMRLDKRSNYALLSATHVYSSLDTPDRLRILINFIHEEFLDAPAKNWQWMAAATTLAKNKVKDEDYALILASDLREHTFELEEVPNWAKEMEIYLLRDLNRFDAAADLVLKFVRSGKITDPQEFQFHIDKLEKLRQDMGEAGEIKDAEQLYQMFDKVNEIIEEYLNRNPV